MTIVTSTKTINLTAGGGSEDLILTDLLGGGVNTIYTKVYVTGNATLTAPWTITNTGTVLTGTVVEVYYNATMVTAGANNITILGNALTDQQALKKHKITYIYTGAAWVMYLDASLAESETIETANIQDGAVTAAKIDGDAVITSKILDLNVTTAKINDLAVTTAKIDNTAVTTAKLGLLSVDSTILAAGAVTTAKIDALAVTDAELAANAVTTAKITDANVTNAKLASNAVTDVKITDGTITGIKHASDTIPSSKLTQQARTFTQYFFVSFETNRLGDYNFRVWEECNMLEASAYATDTIEATNDATITFKDDAGATAGTVVLTAGETIGATEFTDTFASNNSFAAGDLLTLTTSKVTAGGAALVAIKFERTDT